MNRELFDPKAVINTAAPTSLAATFYELFVNQAGPLCAEDAFMVMAVPLFCTTATLCASICYRNWGNKDLAFARRRARELRNVNPVVELSPEGTKQGNGGGDESEYVKTLNAYYDLQKLKNKSSLYSKRYIEVVKKLRKLGHRFQEFTPQASFRAVCAEFTGNHKRLAATALREKNSAGNQSRELAAPGANGARTHRQITRGCAEIFLYADQHQQHTADAGYPRCAA